MLLIFGVNTKKNALGEVSQYCPICRRDTQHTIEERANRITLYFIPVLPLGSKRIQRCNLCGHEEPARE